MKICYVAIVAVLLVIAGNLLFIYGEISDIEVLHNLGEGISDGAKNGILLPYLFFALGRDIGADYRGSMWFIPVFIVVTLISTIIAYLGSHGSEPLFWKGIGGLAGALIPLAVTYPFSQLVKK